MGYKNLTVIRLTSTLIVVALTASLGSLFHNVMVAGKINLYGSILRSSIVNFIIVTSGNSTVKSNIIR